MEHALASTRVHTIIECRMIQWYPDQTDPPVVVQVSILLAVTSPIPFPFPLESHGKIPRELRPSLSVLASPRVRVSLVLSNQSSKGTARKGRRSDANQPCKLMSLYFAANISLKPDLSPYTSRLPFYRSIARGFDRSFNYATPYGSYSRPAANNNDRRPRAISFPFHARDSAIFLPFPSGPSAIGASALIKRRRPRTRPN